MCIENRRGRDPYTRSISFWSLRAAHCGGILHWDSRVACSLFDDLCNFHQLLIQRGDRLTEENKSQSLADVLAEALRLERIIENLLLLSRAEIGHELRTEPISLTRLAWASTVSNGRAS